MNDQLGESTLQWQQLSRTLERFSNAWKNKSSVPEVRDFLPISLGPMLAVVASELVKFDVESRLKSHSPLELEEYFESIPELLDDGSPPCDLVFEEFQLRKRYGYDPIEADYFARFSSIEPSLRRLFGASQLHHSTSLAEQIPSRDFSVGESVDDFALVNEIGSGAFGKVFLARQVSMQRLVALKITTQKSNEPQTLAQLEHPGIVRVFDQRHCANENLWLLYMQFVPGGTLRELIELVRRTPPTERSGSLLLRSVDTALEKSAFPTIESDGLRRKLTSTEWPEIVCRIGIQIALALDYAHRRGVLHRDVKPANILLSSDGSPKLADFNISFASTLEGASAEAFFGGSLAYMSPEQLEAYNPEIETRPDQLDNRADLYSLAAVLWELLYGERPYPEKGLSMHRNRMLQQLVEMRQTQKPFKPHTGNSVASDSIAEVLIRVMSANPNDRPCDGAEIARELRLCLEPKTKSLIDIPKVGWRNLVRQHPMLASILVVIGPNALAGWFNYAYNRSQVVQEGEQALIAFYWIVMVLNFFYFSAGALIARRLIGPVTSAVRRSVNNESISAEDAIAMRLRSLSLPRITTWIGIALWLSSGVVFPLSLQWLAPHISSSLYLHFVASMTICGLIAAAYPFFGLSLIVVRVFYPALLRVAAGGEEDEAELHRLQQGLTKPFFAAAIVPLASMLMVVLLDVQSRYVSLGLILSGLVGLGIVYFLYHRIRDDIEALIATARPLDSPPSESRTASMR